ncbi:MAG: hypothetical protein U1E46_16020 [Hyphomicrobiales bacterium]
MRLRIVTDEAIDKVKIEEALAAMSVPAQHRISVHAKVEGDDIAASRLAAQPTFRQFREGHPCWRKVTDPLLYAENGEEVIILDPDVYFPNRFRFEPSPGRGVYLMWQRPNCLYPPEVVEQAISQRIRLAHHVDIGVAQYRAPLDLDWLDWFVATIGGKNLPRHMHVEAVTWAALAMRIGGGYFDAVAWRCWHRDHWKRVLLKLGASGASILKYDDLSKAKCFHASGQSKWWVVDACKLGLFDRDATVESDSPVRPFVELMPQRYAAERFAKTVLHKVGYYRAINPT